MNRKWRENPRFGLADCPGVWYYGPVPGDGASRPAIKPEKRKDNGRSAHQGKFYKVAAQRSWQGRNGVELENPPVRAGAVWR